MAAMLNLVSDPWIPVLRRSGPDTIRPDQIAEPDILRPDWPRPDLNLACFELLIGLVYLAHPPSSSEDRAHPPDAATLRAAMKALAPAFNLLGEGPRFLQDLEALEGDGNPPDMLFIDSAGDSTAKKNADLMVRRGRYQALPLPLAAMALYTLQAFAPSGGAGNRTSMRGGGPMVTLVKPEEEGLWPLVWANVPRGQSLAPDDLEALPWMRPTETSKPVGKKFRVTVPGSDSPSQARPRGVFRPAPAFEPGGAGWRGDTSHTETVGYELLGVASSADAVLLERTRALAASSQAGGFRLSELAGRDPSE